jgi:hypothetical protein
MKESGEKDLIGCCGLYCGLCNKYQSKSPSRCIGCKLGEQHSWCSIWVCCVKKHGFKNCTECEEKFVCEIFRRRKVSEWIPAVDNLQIITKDGLKSWLREQKERQALLEELLNKYNEGRSMNYYCKVCARMPMDMIRKAVKKAKENITNEKVEINDIKSKARIVKEEINIFALKFNISLK